MAGVKGRQAERPLERKRNVEAIAGARFDGVGGIWVEETEVARLVSIYRGVGPARRRGPLAGRHIHRNVTDADRPYRLKALQRVGQLGRRQLARPRPKALKA